MKAYQADIAAFENSGAQVIGISVDSPAKNKAFAESLGASFPILSDSRRTVSKAYGVLIPIIRLAKRTTFVIDREGIIQAILRKADAENPDNALGSCSLLA